MKLEEQITTWEIQSVSGGNVFKITPKVAAQLAPYIQQYTQEVASEVLARVEGQLVNTSLWELATVKQREEVAQNCFPIDRSTGDPRYKMLLEELARL